MCHNLASRRDCGLAGSILIVVDMYLISHINFIISNPANEKIIPLVSGLEKVRIYGEG